MTEIVAFAGASGSWWRIFYPRRGQETNRTYPAAQVRMVETVAAVPAVADVLAYWKNILARIPTTSGPTTVRRRQVALDRLEQVGKV